MSDLKVNGNTIATVLGCKKAYAAQKIVNTALDGSIYVQNTGKAVDRRLVHAFCATVDDRDDLDAASNDGATVTIEWRGKTLVGYIAENVEWREWSDGHGVGVFTYLVDSEV